MILFRKSSVFDQTLATHSQLAEKLKEFMRIKAQDANARFGSSDKPFTSNGFYSNSVPSLKHAHLSFDVSIVYRMHGSNPRIIDLYGLFSHDDLGTGQPANRKKQKTRAATFSREKFSNLN